MSSWLIHMQLYYVNIYGNRTALRSHVKIHSSVIFAIMSKYIQKSMQKHTLVARPCPIMLQNLPISLVYKSHVCYLLVSRLTPTSLKVTTRFHWTKSRSCTKIMTDCIGAWWTLQYSPRVKSTADLWKSSAAKKTPSQQQLKKAGIARTA